MPASKRASRALAASLLIALTAGTSIAGASVRRAPAPPSARLAVVLALRADDAGLSRFAAAVSTPGSPLYGAYEPIPMLARRFGAPAAARRRAAAFLARSGGRKVTVSPTGMFVQAELSVADAERVFRTRLVRYTGPGRAFIAPAAAGGLTARAAAAATPVPAGLRSIVTGVIGLSTQSIVSGVATARTRRFGARAAAASAFGPGPNQPASGYEPASGTPQGCAGALRTRGFTPAQYLTAYGFDGLTGAGLSGQGERVALIEIDGFKASDIRAFSSCFGLRLPPIDTHLVGSTSPQAPGGEATLDLEVLDAAAPGLSRIEVYESPGNAAEVVDSFAAPLITPGAKPELISASLGLCEPDMYQSFGRSGIQSVERDVELAASTGITLLASSGDAGSSGCQDNQGNPVDALAVSYPASSPDVTAVGGTNIVLGTGNALAGQVAWNDTSVEPAAGGGGVSSLFKRPAYQGSVAGLRGRGVPDVSMLADVAPGYAVLCTANAQGCSGWTSVGGTSAAAPLLAGGLARVDQDLHRQGHEFLGLINPLLYTLGASGPDRAVVYSDVTQIGNDLGPFLPGSGGKPLGCCEAGAGYDTASGWGSLNLAGFDGLALKALPKFGDVSLVIPRPQRPVRARGIRITLVCSTACRAYAYGFVDIGGGSGFNLRSKTLTFRTGGSQGLTVTFTPAQESELRHALAQHRGAQAELFGVALDARGQVAKVTAGRLLGIGS